MTTLSIKLSVITVTLNAFDNLVETVKSVNHQTRRSEVEYIVVDGMSNDGTLQFLNENCELIDKIVSAKDRGVYDAMNKGLKLASGEFILFLNAGDVFCIDESLSIILNELDGYDVLYSDVLVDNGKTEKLFKTSFEDRILNHQGFVYRKNLHSAFGTYAVINGFTAADYLFFLQLNSLNVKKLSNPIAIFQTGGLSSTINAVQQKYCLDFLSGKISALSLAFRLLIYPTYRLLNNKNK